MVSRAGPLEEEDWYVIARRAHRDPDALDLRMSDEGDMPFASGFINPTIVIPAASRLWTSERREAVLLHERR